MAVKIGTFLFIIGLFEFPFLLKDSIARSVFNESLFHSIKTVKTSSFTFQSPQNIAYSLPLTIGLAYLWFKKKDSLALSILCIEVLFVLAGIVYLSLPNNFKFIPPFHALEVSLIVIYFIFGAKSIEIFLSTLEVPRPVRMFTGPILLFVSISFVAIKMGAAFEAEDSAR